MPQVGTPGMPSFLQPTAPTPDQATNMARLQTRVDRSVWGRIRYGGQLRTATNEAASGPGSQARRDRLVSQAPLYTPSSLGGMFAAAAAARDRVLSGGGVY